MELVVRPEAERDLAEASDWYRDDSGVIAPHPTQFPHAGKLMRRASVRGFPYSVFYMAVKSKIIVIAVFHHRRDLSALDERLN
jgi:plasmid stabilization system protein ParE